MIRSDITEAEALDPTPTLTHTPVLTTERMILRAPVAADWEAFAGFMASDRSRFVRPEGFDRAKAWRAFGHIVGMWVLRGYGQFVLTERGSGRPIGTVGPWFPEGWPEREVGWSIWAREAEGKGYAREATAAVLAHVFGPLGWDSAVSYIDPANAASIALAERLGARRDAAAPCPAGLSCHVYRHSRPEHV